MPEIKLTYFNGKGRAEISRLILAYAGVKYTDDRLEMKDWAKLKPSTPWGSLPILHVDGQAVGQSLTIARFLAREHGIAGRTSLEMARADEIVDVFKDLFDEFLKIVFGGADKAEKEAAMKVFVEETATAKFAKLEVVFGRGRFLAGDCLTWADLEAFNLCTRLVKINPKILDKTPKLARLVKYVGDLPNIKKWLQERPQTSNLWPIKP